jgi:4'-phosphopantetheinyl transferase
MNQIAKQFFSIKENEILSSLCEGNRKKAFFNCWTRKEAYLKGIGAGLSHPLNKFDVTLTPGAPARLLRVEGDSKATSHWSIQDLEPAAGVAAAFAVEGRGWRVHCWQW